MMPRTPHMVPCRRLAGLLEATVLDTSRPVRRRLHLPAIWAWAALQPFFGVREASSGRLTPPCLLRSAVRHLGWDATVTLLGVAMTYMYILDMCSPHSLAFAGHIFSPGGASLLLSFLVFLAVLIL